VNEELKSCCASFYQSDVVRVLLGDVFHPGGLALTHHLGGVIDLTPDSHVLDVACGRGVSAVHLAKQFGCHVTGVDYGMENVARAQAHAAENRVAHLTRFRQGDAEKLPFESGIFDAVVAECSFCTFPDKATAAGEFVRVLKPGGRLGLTDMTLDGRLPDDIASLLAWVACVAGADTPGGYVTTLESAGFADFLIEDQGDALLEMVMDVRRRLLGVELAAKLGKLDLGNLDLDEGKRLARRAVELIECGTVGYTLIAARKSGK
jgi:arsenite methyltransferase